MHVTVWEFTVPEAHREAFEDAYGPDGDWAMLFTRAAGYRGNELLQDETVAGRYVAIERWDSFAHFFDFRLKFDGDYEDLERKLVGLATREIPIGTFRLYSEAADTPLR